MTLNGVMAVTLRYFNEFDKHTLQHITAASSCSGIYAGVYCIYNFVSRVRCRRKKSSRSLSHLLMSFLFKHRSLKNIFLLNSTENTALKYFFD